MEENFLLDLVSALDQSRSQKQVNADIKTLEKTINMLQLTATLAKGNSKKEINAYINTLSDQLSTIKLKAKIDSKNLKSEINSALSKVSFKDIDVLNIDENKTKLKAQKVIADAKAYAEKNPINIGINYENRRNKLDNDLTAYLNRHTKISESSVLLKEADKVRNLIGAINDKKSLREATDAFQLYKSEVSATGFASKSTADRIKSMFGHITKLGGLFSVTSLAVNNFTKSLGTLKDIDDILTEISKTSDLTAQKLEELGNASFKSASKYGKTASDYLTGIQEMSRSGFYGDKGTAMAEQSLLAQAAGDMSADVANKYILATNAAYKYNGEATKLNAVLDGQNSITNRNSVALSDMAIAMSEAGTVASSYRVSIEDLSAMIGTMEAVTKLGGSEVGNGIKAILINLQNVTSSKITDTLDAANASMTEFVNGTEKLRDPISILRDLAETFNKLDEDDALRAEILTNIGGKHQAAKLAALLQNMELFDKQLVDYSEGSGSALEEAMKSANNLSGKLNQLQNSWDSLVNSIVNKNSVLSGLTFGDKLIQGVESFIDTFGEIPVLLTTINTAMTAMKKDYGITQLVNPETKKLDVQGNLMGIDISRIKNLKKHYEEAETAIAKWNSRLAAGKVDINKFDDALVKNSAQFKAYLQTTSKDAPASLAGYKASLNAAGVSTDTLRLKTILLNSAISMVIGVAIQGIAKALDDYIHRLDNAKEALSSTQSELSSINSEINDTTAKIAELEALDPSSLSITDKEDLQRLKDQNEELRIRQKYLEDQEKYDLRKVADLTKEKYGQKYGNVNRETVDEYRSLYANKDTKTVPASSYLTGGGTSSQPMPYAASKQNTDAMRGSGTLADLIAQYEYYIELKKEAVQNNDVDGVKQYDDKLSEIAERLRSDRTELQGFSDDLKAAGGTSKELDNITWQLKAIDDLLLSPGQRLANFLDKDILAEDKQKLVDLANAGKLTQNELASDFSEVDKYLKENGLTLDDLISVVKIYKEELADVTVDEIGNLSIAQTIDQLNTQIKPAFDSLKSAWQEIFTDDGFALNSIDILSTCDSIKSKLDEMSEVGLNVDYSAFENLVTVLNNTESTEQDVENAFDSLATSITNAGLSGTEDFETMKAALEDLGVVNNEMVAFDNLISKTNALADAGIDLANATEAEMQAFVNESVSAENAGEALALLHLKKALVNQETITTAADCQNILELAQAANVGIAYLNQLNTLMNLITQRDSAHASGDSRAVSELNRAIKDFSANIVDNLKLDDVKVDFTPIGSGAKSAGKSAGKDYKDGLKEELNDLNSVISGITGRIDDQISTIRSQKEAALESIDAQIDALNEQKSALEAQKKALEDARDAAVEALEEERDARIEVIEQQQKQLELAIKSIDKQIKQKEKVIKSINDEIKAMQDANAEKRRQIDLQKAMYELERLQHQRTILQYSEGMGMHYVTDSKNIRDQKDKVDDAKLEIEIANKQKQIDLIEKEIDLLNEKKDAINEQIDLLDEQIEKINEYYDKEIEKVEKFYDEQIKAIDAQIESIDKQIEALQKQREQTEKYYESLIENLEKSKSKYEELTELVGRAELSAALQKLGIDEEALLNGSEEEFQKLKAAYMDVVFKLNEGNDEVLSALQELSGYNGTAPAMLEDSNGKLDEMNGKLDTSNQNVGNVNSSLGETATTTSNVTSNVADLNANLSETSTIITAEQAAFDALRQKIDEVITAINEKITATQAAQATTAVATTTEMACYMLLKEKILEVKESLDAISNTVTTLDATPVNNLTTAFQLLYNQLLLVSTTLGAGMEGAEEGAVGGITSAIQALNEISLEDGIIAQFTNLKTAVDEVTAAIGGGGGGDSESSSGGEGSGGSSGGSKGGSSGKSGGGDSEGEGGGGGSLTDAITQMGETAGEVIGEPDAEGDGTVIGEFGALETAVNDVTTAIGSGESEGGEGSGEGEDGNLIGSIIDLGDTTEEELGESGGDGIIGRFEEFRDVIEDAAKQVASISDGLDEIDGKEVECTITINIKVNGDIPAFASGTVLGNMQIESATYNAKYGKAFANGTIGLPKAEKNALVSEYGQTEMTVLPDGKTIVTDTPTMMNLPKDTVIYNEEQTKKILSNKIDVNGTAHADGTTDDEGWFTAADGTKLRPHRPGDRSYDLCQKIDAYLKSIDNNLDIITVNANARYEKDMTELEKHVTNNVNNVTNNRNVQPVINQNVTINCPNVTNDSGVENIQKQLGNLSLRAYQEPLRDY